VADLAREDPSFLWILLCNRCLEFHLTRTDAVPKALRRFLDDLKALILSEYKLVDDISPGFDILSVTPLGVNLDPAATQSVPGELAQVLPDIWSHPCRVHPCVRDGYTGSFVDLILALNPDVLISVVTTANMERCVLKVRGFTAPRCRWWRWTHWMRFRSTPDSSLLDVAFADLLHTQFIESTPARTSSARGRS
jgi:hypothetical protein